MSRPFLLSLLALAFLAAPAFAPAATSVSGSALAAATINNSKSNTWKVTGVNAGARTFTAVTKDGKQMTFIAPKGGALPTVGKIYDVTYTPGSGGGPAQATTVHGSKSNHDL
jgi:hypothetical protein